MFLEKSSDNESEFKTEQLNTEPVLSKEASSVVQSETARSRNVDTAEASETENASVMESGMVAGLNGQAGVAVAPRVGQEFNKGDELVIVLPRTYWMVRGFAQKGRRKAGAVMNNCVPNTYSHSFYYSSAYLDWPRIHFSGKFVGDVPTTNNFRCYFQPDDFCPTCNTDHAATGAMAAHVKDSRTPRFDFPTIYPYRLGNGHFYFHDTKVTSVCWKGESDCVTKDPIVERPVENPSRGRMVNLDVDWQQATEIFGLKVHIPGVLNAQMTRSVMTSYVQRQLIANNATKREGDAAMVAYYKGKLIGLEWIDPFYEIKFQNATELSIRFFVDNYNWEVISGRITGTIGLTSPDDPIMVFGAREMKSWRSPSHGEVPFFLSKKPRKLVLDMGGVVPCDGSGNFSVSDYNLIDLDIVVIPHSDEIVESINCDDRRLHCDGMNLFMLTQGGALDKVHKSQEWYTTYGGVVEISLEWTTDAVFDMLSKSRIGIVNQSSTPDSLSWKSDKKIGSCGLCTTRWDPGSSSDKSCKIFMMENRKGVNIKPKQDITHRLNHGETWKIETVSTSFGRPLKNATVEIEIVKDFTGMEECKLNPSPCSPEIAQPTDIFELNNSVYTDVNGLAELSISVVEKPGFPRKCGLDGQIYPIGIILSHSTFNGVVRIGDGGMFGQAMLNQSWQSKARLQCNLCRAYNSMNLALQVYGSLPKEIMEKTCPSWEDGVGNIFNLYANIAPVMAKRNILNLRDINSVREKLRLVNMSMFEFDWEHPNFMPVTRDLSGDKTELIRKWIECEASENPEAKSDTTPNRR
ncbi:unnamed protein product [Clavelina lepadiformis]|uniref:Uncharacterized protein n=1 Tax=Clavelina lepadiformis TaxID=159417 RepID=A0ABP0FSU6_CLALP